MSEQNNATNSLAHTKWNCKYHMSDVRLLQKSTYTYMKVLLVYSRKRKY